MTITLHHGDCLDVLAGMADNSVDSIVTDPPYGLGKEPDALEMLRDWLDTGHHTPKSTAGFMGKAWDAFVPQPAMWAECLRVLKPGGHVLAFAGTRTQDLMALGLRIAGFEIRDLVAWVYGQGFPKSLDVSKAIDKTDMAEEQERRRLYFTAWVRSQGVTSRQIDKATGTNMGGHYTTAASQPAIMTREHLEACRHLFRDVPQWVEQEADIRSVESRNMAKREVVGRSANGIAGGSGQHAGEAGVYGFKSEFDITTPATDAARQWQGWGTALKPALEPITLARKPLAGTVAANVLQHGTGALNIDGCRVETTENLNGGTYSGTLRDPGEQRCMENRNRKRGIGEFVQPAGRWPANLIHDGSDEVLAAFPAQAGGGDKRGACAGTRPGGFGNVGAPRGAGQPNAAVYADTGSAARFFWSPKASSAERHEGLEHPGHQFSMGRMPHDAEQVNGKKRGNHHPTVKPVDLMRYLCRLITPPGGVVLDPYMGSGSTIKAAELEGFHGIGIELDAEYVEIARRRIAADAPLFADVKVER